MYQTFLHYRSKQIDQEQKAAKKYYQSNKDVTHWLENMERKVGQLQTVSTDPMTLQTQVEQLKVS